MLGYIGARCQRQGFDGDGNVDGVSPYGVVRFVETVAVTTKY